VCAALGGPHRRSVRWCWHVQQQACLVDDGQAAVQALVDLNDQTRIAEAIATGPRLQHLAGEAQGVIRGDLAGCTCSRRGIEVSV
jgi:hypothetical protein